MSVDQFEEAKEANQKWEYSNERTSESWRKVEATWDIESRVLIDKGTVMIVHALSGWLASSYPIRRALLQHINWRVPVESVMNERKSSCHFAWRNGSIAVWIFVHPTENGSDIGLERLPYKSQSKIISINIRISPLLSRMKVKHARISEITILILSLKFIGSFEAAAFSITTKLAFRAWSL